MRFDNPNELDIGDVYFHNNEYELP